VTDAVLPVEMTSDEQCLDVEEQMVVDSEVLVHGGDLIQTPDCDLVVPLSSPTDQQSVAVVELGQAAAAAGGKALIWAYGRPPTFYVSPAGFLSSVPTAVVAPIKRETPDAVQQCGPQQSAAAQSHSEYSSLPSAAQVLSPTPFSKAHLPPFETFRAPAISGGSSSMTSSGSAAASDAASSAMNLCLATRSTDKSQHDTQPLPPTSFYRHPAVTSSNPFPVWGLPTAALSAEDGTQPRSQCSTADQLVVSSPLKTSEGHVIAQALPVQQIPPFTTAEVIASASRCGPQSDSNTCI